MKFFLLTFAVFALSFAVLHAQVPAVPVDPETALTNALPPAWQLWGTLLLVTLPPILGRVYHAIVSGGGLKGIWNALIFGTNTPVKLLIACLALLTLPSCVTMKKIGAALSTPQAKQVELALVDVGMHIALADGVITPGDVVTIGNGEAVVTSGDTTISKVVKLSKLGLDTAVSKGLVKPGDAVLVKESTAVITRALTPVVPIAVPVAAVPAA